MNGTIQKWGNSQGVRLPKPILDALKWSTNDKITIKTQDNKIVIELAEPKKHKTIKELFKEYDGNYVCEEIDWGGPEGREVW